MGLDMYLSIRKYVGRLDLSAGYDEVKGWSHDDQFDLRAFVERLSTITLEEVLEEAR